MLSEECKNALKRVAQRLNDSGIPWHLVGSSNCSLQGVDMQSRHPVVLFENKYLEKFLKIFALYKKTEAKKLKNGEAEEFFMYVDGVEFLICAEFPFGVYLQINEKPIITYLDEVKIPSFSLQSEEKAYRLLGASKKADVIRRFLEEQ
jgi:hypothetical protein